MRRFIPIFLLFSACGSSSPPPSPLTQADHNEKDAAAKAVPAATATGPLVIPPPTGTDATHIFKGRVLVSGTSEVFCRSSYYDDDAKSMLYWTEINGCSYTEDEVSVEYRDNGNPDLDTAAGELNGRFAGGCIEDARFLAMVKWPAGRTKLEVKPWLMEAEVVGRDINVRIKDDETAAFSSHTGKIRGGQTIESIHLHGTTVVVRTIGTREGDGHPQSQCMLLE